MSQLTLIMPCLPCVPDCIWPPNPSMGILFLPSALSNFVCTDCLTFNDGAILPFIAQFPTIPPTCVFESPFDPICGADFFRVSTQFDNIGGGAIITCRIQSNLPKIVIGGTRILTPAEVVANGPFDITSISSVSLDCNWNIPWATVEGLT